jgi:hypothetical protein
MDFLQEPIIGAAPAPSSGSPETYWELHGTKVLGSLTTVLGVVQSALPQLDGIISHKTYVLAQFFLAIVTGVLGAFTVRRGFVNSANLT